MLYALFGIPVYILYFMNMGKVVGKKTQTIHYVACNMHHAP